MLAYILAVRLGSRGYPGNDLRRLRATHRSIKGYGRRCALPDDFKPGQFAFN